MTPLSEIGLYIMLSGGAAGLAIACYVWIRTRDNKRRPGRKYF